MIIENALGDRAFIQEDNTPQGSLGSYIIESIGDSHPVYMDNMDYIGLQNLFYSLSQEEIMVVTALYLGFKPKEIIKILKFKNIGRFYAVTAKIRQSYKDKKHKFLG